MKCRGRQRILIRAPVEFLAHQLFGRGVEHRTDRHVGCREVAGVVDPAGNAEVAQQNTLLASCRVG